MLKLRIPEGISWELLVVDNNSTDETSAVLARYADKLPLRALFEPRQGKSHACNLLVSQATGDLILWTDDDVLVAPDWIEQYVLAARQWPQATFFGGTIDPWFEAPPPKWMLNGLESPLGPLAGALALLQLGEDVRPLKGIENPYGANMALRTDVLRRNPFDVRVGPTGQQMLRGEDTRLIEKLKEQGELGIWVGPAKVRHWVPRERMTRKYIWKWYFGTGVTAIRIRGLEPGRRVFGIPPWIIRRLFGHMLAWSFGWLRLNHEGCASWRHMAIDLGLLVESRRHSQQTDGSGTAAASEVAL
jgi:glycosyltransferase involved in cell wall biosynthesis